MLTDMECSKKSSDYLEGQRVLPGVQIDRGTGMAKYRNFLLRKRHVALGNTA